MYCIFFYFSILDLQKILEFIDILNKWFEKYFKVRYDWLARTDTERFLKLRSECELEENEIYWVTTINSTWPYNMIKFWDDSFYISTEASFMGLWYKNMTEEETSELEQKQRSFAEEMLEKLPLLWVVWCFEEYNDHISDIASENSIKYSAFIYKKENWKIKFYEWKSNIDWFERSFKKFF